jgi:HK97 family phage major capsid protein
MEALIKELSTSFEEFKRLNDERLKAVEEGKATSELDEKLSRLNAAMDESKARMDDIEAKANRSKTAPGESREAAEHKQAFEGWVRKGVDSGLHDLERKALNVTTDADGGYAVPEDLDRSILDLVQNSSPMRKLCTVIQVGTSDYKKLVNKHGATSGWVDEDDARSATTTPSLAQVTPFMGELYAMPQATQTMLDDVFFNVESWLKSEIAEQFASAEGSAFISGDGSKKPKGIMSYTSVVTDDGSRTFGQLQHLVAASETAVTTNELIQLIYKLKAGLRTGASWMMNKGTIAILRQLKDSTGQYMWAPGMVAGQPSTLFGYPVHENEDMAAAAADAVPVAFGNFKRGYYIVDRMGVRMLRDPYTAKPYVSFYSTKRVGGMLVDSDAIKLLKMKASA